MITVFSKSKENDTNCVSNSSIQYLSRGNSYKREVGVLKRSNSLKRNKILKQSNTLKRSKSLKRSNSLKQNNSLKSSSGLKRNNIYKIEGPTLRRNNSKKELSQLNQNFSSRRNKDDEYFSGKQSMNASQHGAQLQVDILDPPVEG